MMKSKLLISLLLGSIIFIIYSPILYFPYFFADAIWIVRGAESDYAPLSYISETQGRPAFATIILFHRIITSSLLHITAIQLTTMGALILFIFWSIGFLYWLERSIPNLSTRIILVVGISVTPAFQMFIFGGPWLAAGLVATIVSAFYLRNTAGGNLWRLRLKYVTATLILVVCWALYQSIPAVLLGYFLFTWLASIYEIRCCNDPFILKATSIALLTEIKRVIGSVLISLLLYIGLWWIFLKLYPNVQDQRYSITSIDLTTVGTKLYFFITERIPQAMNLWSTGAQAVNINPKSDISTSSVIFLKNGIFFYISIYALVVFSSDLFKIAKNIHHQFYTNIVSVLLLVFLALDLPAFMGKEPNMDGRPILSYMTLSALTIGIIAIIYFSLIHNNMWLQKICRYNYFYKSILFLTLILFGVDASLRFAVPRHQEYMNIVDAVRIADCTESFPTIIDFKLIEHRRAEFGEFGWRTINASYNAFWLVLNALDDLNIRSDRTILIRDTSGSIVSMDLLAIRSGADLVTTPSCYVKVNH
jgi:hypothetical protein